MSNVQEKLLYTFTCDGCGRRKRKTKHRWIAEEGICTRCKAPKQISGQLAAFN